MSYLPDMDDVPTAKLEDELQRRIAKMKNNRCWYCDGQLNDKSHNCRQRELVELEAKEQRWESSQTKS